MGRAQGQVMLAKRSPCGRFAVVDHLHIDRELFEALERWASTHGLHVQDAIQIAVCALLPLGAEQHAHDVLEVPDGTELELLVVDELDDEDRERLHAALRESEDDFSAGRTVPAKDVIDELRRS